MRGWLFETEESAKLLNCNPWVLDLQDKLQTYTAAGKLGIEICGFKGAYVSGNDSHRNLSILLTVAPQVLQDFPVKLTGWLTTIGSTSSPSGMTLT